MDNTLNAYEVINKKYKDIKSKHSNTENVNIEEIDLIQKNYFEKLNYIRMIDLMIIL